MALIIRNNRLEGVLPNNQKWSIKLSLQRNELAGMLSVKALLIVNGNIRTTNIVCYRIGESKRGYGKALQVVLEDCERTLGVQILSNQKLKVA
ncbi:hypothetical protein J2Q11_12295 [Tenacibaculum finnmarkense genomovar finnmarkense]|uniref:hypothetical protein n=1 Tax=Tenacibaculum finnmarkense TaxID=2781243 RepID=UPI001EFB14A9|nr:hypothetical protein [Tenacibaculum finnmarkense]MCG8213595.1 hypothetical protein [Tenacibaculum finnmarkense genomovar finnmarkense]MCG8231910.1 hypothetical protein [Tenacibaculum finnmarkense genomovar finnmarkense]MCG8886476.1 hypothetical protein [Tenacibaculum finnmarkense]MCG8897258.1 hypothetical protein [Tenacibaculum finnmarkense]MCG8903964.1 hypothetical protein [Tenacibaculum finnmarkense]